MLHVELNDLLLKWWFCYFWGISSAPAAPGRSAVVTHLHFAISWIFWEQACCCSSYIPMSYSLEIVWSNENWCLWQHSTGCKLCNRGSYHLALNFYCILIFFMQHWCSWSTHLLFVATELGRILLIQFTIAAELELILFIQFPSIQHLTCTQNKNWQT